MVSLFHVMMLECWFFVKDSPLSNTLHNADRYGGGEHAQKDHSVLRKPHGSQSCDEGAVEAPEDSAGNDHKGGDSETVVGMIHKIIPKRPCRQAAEGGKVCKRGKQIH